LVACLPQRCSVALTIVTLSRDARAQKLTDLKRSQKARDRRSRLLWIAGVLVVVVALATAIAFAARSSGGKDSAGGVTAAGVAQQVIPSSPAGATTTERAPNQAADTSGINGVKAWDTTGWPGDGKDHPGALQHDHVTGPVQYVELPPVGGAHSGIWMNAGVYTKPIPAERAVHDMEHGAVWITYVPNLPASEVKQLVSFVGRQSLVDESQATTTPGQSNRYIDLSPWPTDSLPSPIVLSAWGHQLQVTSATDPRMQQFVDTFRNSANTPEYGAAVDGIPVQTGGRPAVDGGTKPNPPGAANAQ